MLDEPNAANYCFNRAGLQAMDRRATMEYGLPLAGLMELAGVAVARLSATLLPPGGSVVILTGSGHNGADGLVAARHLANWGYQPYLCLANAQSEYRDLAGGHLHAVQQMNLPLVTQAQWPTETMLVIDAVLGT
ncbi:MAG: NAD(P)H-hydrate epimerase, partial [Phycisphaerae bacterium]